MLDGADRACHIRYTKLEYNRVYRCRANRVGGDVNDHRLHFRTAILPDSTPQFHTTSAGLHLHIFLIIRQHAAMSLSFSRLAVRAGRIAAPRARTFATSARLRDDKKNEPVNAFPNDRAHPNSKDWAKTQTGRPTNPHLTNTTSTIANDMPSVGADNAPPELLTAVDPKFEAKDSVPENTQRMTGGTQSGGPSSGPNAELGVGEMEGVSFKVEPNRRSGEDINTLRARLLCPSCRL